MPNNPDKSNNLVPPALPSESTIFPPSAVKEFNEQFRRDKVLAKQGLRFELSRLGLLGESKFFETYDCIRHTRVITSLSPDENDQSLFVAMTTVEAHADLPGISVHAMTGYWFNLSHDLMNWIPENRIYRNDISGEWEQLPEGWGPYVEVADGFIEVKGWHQDSLLGGGSRWTAEHIRATQNLAKSLSGLSLEDAQIYPLMQPV